ncbi:hypothetical protein GGR53DRAFT_530305 [Hypoxylon sp. FL1150]|nr:hypothetical protein GGR53DRAFT_530305 [Hypoxylon sp. FL1150]
MSRPFKKPEDSIIWVKGMALGRGARHSPDFQKRINKSKRQSGSGTIRDPMVIWCIPAFSYERRLSAKEEERYRALETIIKQETRECGLSFAWVSAEDHPYSTTSRNTNIGRTMSMDDFHVTVRMGSSTNICNLHGHIYIVYEDNDPNKKPLRAMLERERGVRHGKSPQLWVWGKYPQEWPSAGARFPKSPYETLPGSILDYQMEESQRREKQGISVTTTVRVQIR